MIDSTPRLRRKQLLRLAELLTAYPALSGRWYQDIVRYPINAPVNNTQLLPTFAIYCTRENVAFATTEQDKRPTAFTGLLMFPEPVTLPDGITPQTIYDQMLDTVDDILEAMRSKNIRRDPQMPGLWHQIIFGGDAKANMPTGQFTVQYDRAPGQMQVAVISFMLAANVRDVY